MRGWFVIGVVLGLAGCGAASAPVADPTAAGSSFTPSFTPAITVSAAPGATPPANARAALPVVVAAVRMSAASKPAPDAKTCGDLTVIEGMIAGGDTPAARAKGRIELHALTQDSRSATPRVRAAAQALVAAAERKDELGALRALGSLQAACRGA
jgi:hypothetical protein